MELEEFDMIYKRLVVTRNYHRAFRICLNKLSDNVVAENAIAKIRELVEEHSCKVFEPYSNNYRLQVPFLLDSNWLLDIAINLGYKEVEHAKISTGWFSSVPSIAIGSLLNKHRYGLSRNMKNNTTTIYYSARCFCRDYKMITAISEELIKLYSNRG